MNHTIPTVRARRLLWLALVLALPIPFWGVEAGVAPPLRLLFVGSLVLGFFASAPESTSGLFLGLYLGQGLLWLGGTYLLARLGLRLLGGRDGVPALRLYVILGLLVLVALTPVYELPMSSASRHTNWFGLFY